MKTHLTISMVVGVLAALPGTALAQQPELVVQSGHTDSVHSVAFRPDGTLLASASLDKTIKLWEVATGREVRTITGHSSTVTSVTFNPDGKTLASGSWDETIKLWEVATGREVRTLNGHVNEVNSVTFNRNGNVLASGSFDKTIKLWDVATGSELRTLTGHVNGVFSVAFSPDGRTLASGSADKTIKLWEVATGRELRTLNGHSGGVWSVAFSADGKTIVSGSQDETIKLWDVATGRELRMLTGHSGLVFSVAFSGDGKTLASGSADKTIKLWEASSGRELFTLIGHSQSVASLAFSADGAMLVSGGSKDYSIKLWEVATGRQLRTLNDHSSIILSVAFSADGKKLASGNLDNTIILWDGATGRELRTLIGHAHWVFSVAFSADGKTLASGSRDKTIKLWDVATGRELRTLNGHSEGAYSVAFSADGRTLASGSADNSIKLWELATGRELRTLSGHSGVVASVTFGADGKTLASGGWDKLIKLWDVATGRELRTLAGYSHEIHSVAFSADGKTLASGGEDVGTIKLWNVATGEELRTLREHHGRVWSVAFSPDGKTLVSGSGDDTIKMWDLATGRELRTLAGHSNAVRSVAFSSDGRFLLSGGADTIIKLWGVDRGELLADLIRLDDTDWAVVTPEGRFDASPNAQRLMHWKVGNELIGLEQLKERYYEPGLLSKLLGFNKEPMKNVSALRDVKLFPQVEYGEPDASGKLKIKLTNRVGGIGKVRVLVNGKEIAADARGPATNPQAPQATLTVDLSGASIIPGKPNSVEVVAWNSEGYLSSRGGEIKWTPPGGTNDAATHPDLYAIVVGISDYAGDSFDLSFAAKDAADMAQALKIGARGLFGVNKTHITLLNTSGPEGVPLPTKENIRKAFADVAKQSKPWDVLVIYFSGHGLALGGADDLYLYPTQEARTLDIETLKDTALRGATTINSLELVEWLTKTEWVKGQKGLAPLKRVMILDTCAAGKAGERLTRDPSSLSSAQIRAIDRLKDRTGYHVLMGSAADAVSYEASHYGQGLLTYALLTGMRGAALREDQYVDVSLLFQYAADQVPQLARDVGGIQRPIIAAPQGISFDVGLLKTKEEKSAIPLAQRRPLLLRPSLINRDENVGFDDLELQPVLRERVQEKSLAKVSSRDDAWIGVSVNADDMSGAIRPSGTYVVVGNTVRVTMSLVRDGKRIDSFQVEGNKADKGGLVRLILDGIATSMKKLEAQIVRPSP